LFECTYTSAVKTIRWMGCFCLLAALASGATAADNPTTGSDQRRNHALSVLREALQDDDFATWAPAARFLMSLDYPQDVEATVRAKLAQNQLAVEAQIALWEALAGVAAHDHQQQPWIENLRHVAHKRSGPGRQEAASALGRLGHSIDNDHDVSPPEVDPHLRKANERWLRLAADHQQAEAALVELLKSNDAATRAAAAKHALQQMPSITPQTAGKLLALASKEPPGSPARPSLSGAAAVHAPQQSRPEQKNKLLEQARTGSAADRAGACEALGLLATHQDLPALEHLMKDPSGQVRASAAYATLRLDRRGTQRLAPLDWVVIGAYALGMLAIGWYYSRRTSNTDDYLLGGRKMRPLSVGLSLFATMLSAVSYLAWPGEVIRYGPMMMCVVLAHPITGLVVGWLVIPFIMKMKVTTAYEILEIRLGLSVRILASVFFLALRLLWMAVIIYAGASKVLVPLMGLPTEATPYVCAVLGVITIIYTSMGGLRAVVITDVVQTLILFAGAIITLVLVTVWMGGVSAWWPQRWAPHWVEPTLFYTPNIRVTVMGAMLASFTWWICTSSSDQMAIQRYLATRDTKAARQVIITSLSTSILVDGLFLMLGLSLWAFFAKNPHLISDGQRLFSDADKLFPRFVLVGLPVGLTGLVVAALLAAAMSSLSSGVNSSCSVVIVDFIDRFRKSTRKRTDSQHVQLAKWVSILIGVVVVALSSYVGVVKGNLLEVSYKVVNLLVGPLAGLFFMAMFVRWATVLGTMVGAACGLIVVVAINFWEDFTGAKGIGFIWSMPLGVVVQLAVGMLVSLIPVGRRKPLPAD
jgi:SSS family solute:Na+ symporter